jgi:hypothetical protein
MVGITIIGATLAVGLFVLLRYAPPPQRKISESERRRRIATERLCATLLAAEENPMYVIPPQAKELAHQLTNSKELNP